MKVIGIVGGIGAGKSTVIKRINQIKPVSCISADQIGHDVLLKGHEAYEPVINAFGKKILKADDEIDRKKLGEEVFKDPQKLAVLNGITHPLITRIIKDKIQYYKKNMPEKPVFLEAALLLESGLVNLTDMVVAVYADPDLRIQRVVQRDGLPEKQVACRIHAQKSWQELKAAADYVIDTGISPEHTEKQLKELIAIIS